MDVSEPESDDFHAGYSPEQGILQRIRQWTDVFGWLRLGRVLRLAGSPTALILVSFALAVWLLGMRVFGIAMGTGWEPMLDGETDRYQLSSLIEMMSTVGVMTPASILDRPAFHHGVWRTLLWVMWSAFVWTPIVLFLARQGALLTAGRGLADSKSVLSLAIHRTGHAWLIAVMPLVCGLTIGLAIIAAGFLSRVSMGVPWIEFVFAAVVAIVGVAAGILLFGANFAVPLGMASMINEQQPDPLDSLSRGYEYLYRRPLQLAMYVALSIVPWWVVAWLSVGISSSATNMVAMMLSAAGASEHVAWTTRAMLELFPLVVSITLLGGWLGGVYLLIRSDAGGQEVEDIWMPLPQPKLLLPTLPRENV